MRKRSSASNGPKDLVLPESASDVADAKFALAQVLVIEKRETARARQLVTEARDAYQKMTRAPRERRNLARIEAWLERYGSSRG